MGYGRSYGLGFINPRRVNGGWGGGSGGGWVPPRQTVAIAPPIQPKITPIQAPPRMSTPLTHPDKNIYVTDYRTHPDFNVPEEMRFRYSPEQIKDMLARGKSETVERSGESDSGMPDDTAMQTQSRQNGATDAFASSGEDPVKVAQAKPNILPLLLAGAAAYYFL